MVIQTNTTSALLCSNLEREKNIWTLTCLIVKRWKVRYITIKMESWHKQSFWFCLQLNFQPLIVTLPFPKRHYINTSFHLNIQKHINKNSRKSDRTKFPKILIDKRRLLFHVDGVRKVEYTTAVAIAIKQFLDLKRSRRNHLIDDNQILKIAIVYSVDQFGNWFAAWRYFIREQRRKFSDIQIRF